MELVGFVVIVLGAVCIATQAGTWWGTFIRRRPAIVLGAILIGLGIVLIATAS